MISIGFKEDFHIPKSSSAFYLKIKQCLPKYRANRPFRMHQLVPLTCLKDKKKSTRLNSTICYTERITKRKHMVKVKQHQNKATKENIFSVLL